MNGKQAKRLRRALRKAGLDAARVRINGMEVEGRKLYQRAKGLPGARRLAFAEKLEDVT